MNSRFINFSQCVFSRQLLSSSLWPHGLQHIRLPCPSLSPEICSNSCPLSQWCHSAAPFPPSPNLSQHQGLFQWVSSLHRWPKYWSFSFSISLSNDYCVLISFRIESFVVLTIQRTLKSLLQLHSSKPSVLLHSAFFMVQLSHPHMTTGKTIRLNIWIFVGNVFAF